MKPHPKIYAILRGLITLMATAMQCSASDNPTIAVMKNLDLIITVDSATPPAHTTHVPEATEEQINDGKDWGYSWADPSEITTRAQLIQKLLHDKQRHPLSKADEDYLAWAMSADADRD